MKDGVHITVDFKATHSLSAVVDGHRRWYTPPTLSSSLYNIILPGLYRLEQLLLS